MYTTLKKNKNLLGVGFLISALLAFTDFYSIGYLIAVLIPTLTLGNFFIFKTYIQRFVLYLLTLLAIIPIVGLACSMMHIEIFPLYNILAFFVVCGLLYARKSKPAQPSLLDRVDVVALIVAAAPITVMAFSYVTAPDLRVSLLQFASEGWDNGSHVIMLEDVSAQNGYVYNNYSGSNEKFSGGPTAYPLAWHLTTADIANGFGGDRFDDKKPMLTLLAYVIVSVSWMILVCYLLTICSWRCKEHFFGSSRDSIKSAIPLATAISLLILVVIVSSLMHGFTNYIGTIAYLILLSAMVIESQRVNIHYIYILAALFGTMSVLTWFLTLPAAGLTIVLMYVTKAKDVRKSIAEVVKDWRLGITLAVSVIAMATQVIIFQGASGTSAQDQLNAGAKVFPFDMSGYGPLQISPILFGLLTIAVIAYITLNKLTVRTKQTLLILVIPWLLLALGVYLYQNITVGANSYYLPKVIGLSLIATIVPLSGIYATYLSGIKITHPRITIAMLALVIPGVIVVGTGQPAFGIIKLFQTNARTTYSTAAIIVPLLDSAPVINGKSTIVVVSSRVNYENVQEDNHGKLEIRVVNNSRNCTYGITKYVPIETRLHRLALCADKLAASDKNIIVVTSPDLKDKIAALNKSNIAIIVAP